jgi:hypothetical protein
MADAHPEESRCAPAADRNAGARQAEEDDDGFAPQSEVDVHVRGDVDVGEQASPAATTEARTGEEAASYYLGTTEWE